MNLKFWKRGRTTRKIISPSGYPACPEEEQKIEQWVEPVDKGSFILHSNIKISAVPWECPKCGLIVCYGQHNCEEDIALREEIERAELSVPPSFFPYKK